MGGINNLSGKIISISFSIYGSYFLEGYLLYLFNYHEYLCSTIHLLIHNFFGLVLYNASVTPDFRQTPNQPIIGHRCNVIFLFGLVSALLVCPRYYTDRCEQRSVQLVTCIDHFPHNFTIYRSNFTLYLMLLIQSEKNDIHVHIGYPPPSPLLLHRTCVFSHAKEPEGH